MPALHLISIQLVPDPNQYWLVHRTRVDVPSMYKPRGRYWYTHGIVSPCDVNTFYMISENVSQNWRAAAAMVVSVPPTFPGLIDSIKSSANVGAGPHLFDIAYMLGVRHSLH